MAKVNASLPLRRIGQVSNPAEGTTANVTKTRTAGRVALGTDGPASNDTLDLWEEVKIAPLLARVTGLDATLVGPAEVLDMATRGGGRAVGLEDVGCLTPGWAADFQRLDLDHHAFVPVTEPSELLAHVAWGAPLPAPVRAQKNQVFFRPPPDAPGRLQIP